MENADIRPLLDASDRLVSEVTMDFRAALRLGELLDAHRTVAGEICDKVKVLPFFEKYLKCGYYPMYRDVSSQFRSDQGQARQLRRQ